MWRLPFGIARGARLQIDLENWTRLYLGLYERELNPHLRALCEPGSACFDVGAQLGYDALVLARLGAGRVLSFDCDTAACSAMAASFASNPHLQTQLEVRNAGVGATTRDDGSVVALDDVAVEDGGFVPDLIKIDVEGDELLVLEGAERILSERRPHLIVEVHSPALDESCRDLLTSVGYSPTGVDHSRWLRDGRPRGFNRWLVAAGRS